MPREVLSEEEKKRRITERSRRHYNENKEYYAAHKRTPEQRAVRALWEKNNPDKTKEYKKKAHAKDPGKFAARNKRWAEANPEKFKKMRDAGAEDRRQSARESSQRKKASRDAAHGGMPDTCQVCGATGRVIHWDHCHKTEIFRGWLCRNCNMALGLLHDDPVILRLLADYLDRSANELRRAA